MNIEYHAYSIAIRADFDFNHFKSLLKMNQLCFLLRNSLLLAILTISLNKLVVLSREKQINLLTLRIEIDINVSLERREIGSFIDATYQPKIVFI